MPRHSTFKLKDAPLHQKGKILRMSKTYTNQDFAKPTVLTDDVFPYEQQYQKEPAVSGPESEGNHLSYDQVLRLLRI